MTQAKENDTVRVHYTGKLDNGMVFDSSTDRDPLEFTLGEGQVIPGFEQAVMGMEPGETKTVTIPAQEAYGPYREEMILNVDRSQFPNDIEPEIGQQLQVRQANGQVMIVRVIEMNEAQVSLDANHPLAGQNLTFDVHLVDIV